MTPDFPASGSRQCDTAEETRQLGRELGAAVEAGDVIILDGPLGAGKTTFTQGVADGMDVAGRVTSPTFVIAREHKPSGAGASDRPALVHVDAYRLIGEGSAGDPLGELDALDLDTELEDSVVVAEWGGGLIEQIAGVHLLVTIDRESLVRVDPNAEGRIISWQIRTP